MRDQTELFAKVSGWRGGLMAALINRERRERNKEAKQERKARIVEAARHAFTHLPFTRVTLDEIGRRAKVRDGLSTLYFVSKEGLFLSLLNQELDAWVVSVEERLEQVEGTQGPAALVAATLTERPTLTRMLFLLHVVLEQDLEIEASQAFTDGLGRRLKALGAKLEVRFSQLGDGEGAPFLFRATLFAAGLHPVTDPSGMAAPAVRELASWIGDARRELETQLEAVLARRTSE